MKTYNVINTADNNVIDYIIRISKTKKNYNKYQLFRSEKGWKDPGELVMTLIDDGTYIKIKGDSIKILEYHELIEFYLIIKSIFDADIDMNEKYIIEEV